MADRTRSWASPTRAALLAIVVCVVASMAPDIACGAAREEPVFRLGDARPPARVVWTRGDRAYVVGDSMSFQLGQTLVFRNRVSVPAIFPMPVAEGTVLAAPDSGFAVVRVDVGSLEGIPLDRLDAVLSAQPEQRWPRTLRIGAPSARRASIVYSCRRVFPSGAPGIEPMRRDTVSERFTRWVRDSVRVTHLGSPDTVELRSYDDKADEEIALERGELDIAIFWPGELSERMRADRRWQGGVGVVSEHVVVAVGDGVTPPSDSLLAALDRRSVERLFRGDIQWVSEFPAPPRDSNAPRVQFAVDPAWPGARALDRALNGTRRPPAGSAVVVRLVDVNLSTTPRDSLVRMPQREGETLAPGRATPLFHPLVRVLFGSRLAESMHRSAAWWVATLARCEP